MKNSGRMAELVDAHDSKVSIINIFIKNTLINH